MAWIKEHRVSFCIRYKGRGKILSHYDVSGRTSEVQAIERAKAHFARDYSKQNPAFSADSFAVTSAPVAPEENLIPVDSTV